jgi:hypothetical protein
MGWAEMDIGMIIRNKVTVLASAFMTASFVLVIKRYYGTAIPP